MGNLARINDTIQRSLAAAERIFEVIDEEPSIKDDENAIELPRIQGRVEFDRVTFSYDESEETLKEISIKAEPGQIVALVGRSGAGKTSIVNLIPRFYDPKSGRVLVDGFDIKYVRQRALRGQIGMVLQDTFLFNGTARMNIKYGKLDATDEEITSAAEAANAHEFIRAMPHGYDTEIGERGIKLSGGQKQRIAIARAILADPRILILYEATSSVDSDSDYLIHRAMDRLMEGRTTFVIAHRLRRSRREPDHNPGERARNRVGDHKSLDQDGVYCNVFDAVQAGRRTIDCRVRSGSASAEWGALQFIPNSALTSRCHRRIVLRRNGWSSEEFLELVGGQGGAASTLHLVAAESSRSKRSRVSTPSPRIQTEAVSHPHNRLGDGY